MSITRDDKIYDLIKKHPRVKDALVQISPKFKKLNNPVMLNTVARHTTVGKAAKIAGMGSHKLLDKINAGLKKEKTEKTMLKERVEKALEQARPSLQADGGDVHLVEITPEGVVRVRLLGACGGCPMSQLTLSAGIECHLKKEIPEVRGVEAVQ